MKQYFKSFIHNVIIHPLMMFLPTDLAHRLHDKNANWAFFDRVDEISLENQRKL